MRRLLGPLVMLAAMAPAAAQEADPSGDLRAAEELVEAETWGKAYDALSAVLDAHPEDPRLLPHLLRIEREMQRCRFRSTVRQLKPEEVLGPGATRLSATSLQAELRFEAPGGPLWRSGGGAHALEPVFVPPITLSFTASGVYDERHLLHVVFAEPSGAEAGIYVSPGCYESSDDRSAGTTAPPKFQENARIGSIQDGEVVELASRYPMAFSFENKITITVKGDETKLKCGGEVLEADVPAGPCRIVLAAGDAKDIRVKAKLEPEWAQARLDEAWKKAFDAWVEERWVRSKHLPEWVCGALARHKEAGGFGGDSDDIERQLTWSRGTAPWSRGADGERTSPDREVSDRYLEALTALSEGRLAEAERALGDVLGRDPGLDRARVWRTWVRTELRRWDDATSDLVDIRPADVVLAPATLAAARIAVKRDELGLAEEVLAHAAEESTAGPRVHAFLETVRRIRKGPGFANSRGAIRDRFRVIGGVPEARCVEIAEALVGARLHSAQLVGDLGEQEAQCTVFAFPTREDVDRFLTDLEGVVRAGRAAYLPQVPTLVLDASGDPSAWIADLREAAWYEHLDRRAAHVPAWLAAGGARLMRDGEPAVATPDPAVDPRAFVPVAELLGAPAGRLAAGSPFLGQSREVLRVLATHEDPAWRRVAKEIVDAVAAGAAWADVLSGGPLAERLERLQQVFDAAR